MSQISSVAQQQPVASSLAPAFVPADVEGPLYQRWMEHGYFEAHPETGKPPYSIVIPPPNVTGSLHLGHAFEHTLIDALIRRRRMQGYDAVWIPGMDHAGIATQNVVERRLYDQGLTRHDIGREAFVTKVWDWKAESGGQILAQMRRLGDSVDWTRERFTMDDGLSRAVQTIFKRLFDDGYVYRAERIINWCPTCHTALSDIEVEHTEDAGELIELIYGDPDGEDRIVVATTRVETMLGDTGIAVHPGDKRYAHFVGRKIEMPLTGRRLPVVADELVDPGFGTGAVKITPAHDPNDFEIGQRHHLANINVMAPDATIAGTGTRYDGMDRYAAREAIREDLLVMGRIGGQKRPYLHSVGHCSRSGDVVEPRLSLQWFVNVAPLARAAGDAVRDGRVAIHPKELEPRWFAWVDNMHDWCVSRQLWWGHRIPVWYGPDGQIVCVGPDEQPPSDEGWVQDSDVLDTWFSSGLWPFSTLGWPQDTEDLQRYYPNSALVTGYDILFFWVARMMMFGLYVMDGVAPFPVVVLHGMVRDQYGKKMSKSFGNAVNPLDWINAYGADALRFTLARGANPGTDLPIGEEWVQGGRNFCTKLWNATRFATSHGANLSGELPALKDLSAIDRWILSRLRSVIDQVDAAYEDFQFAKAAEALYHFTWNEFCDWYLELAKRPLNAGGHPAEVTRRVLGEVLDVILRLLHPIAPFVTDALWTALTASDPDAPASVMIATWPAGDASRYDLQVDDAVEQEILALQALITEVRRFRAEQGAKSSSRVPARFSGLERAGLAAHEDLVLGLARLERAGPDFEPSISLIVGDAVVELDLSGVIDVAAERKRLEKDLNTARAELERALGQLSNEAFVVKAPAKVVDTIRARKTTAEGHIIRLTGQLNGLQAT